MSRSTKDQSGTITLERAGFKLASHVATPGGPIMANVTDIYEKDGVRLVHSHSMGGESWHFLGVAAERFTLPFPVVIGDMTITPGTNLDARGIVAVLKNQIAAASSQPTDGGVRNG